MKIKRMNFVMEFGEVITSEEVERQEGQLYDIRGIISLIDLEYESDEFTVDAVQYGNVSLCESQL